MISSIVLEMFSKLAKISIICYKLKEYSHKYLKKEMHKSSLKASSTCSNVIKGFDFECNQKNESEYKKNNAEQEEKLLTVFSILFIEESVFGG